MSIDLCGIAWLTIVVETLVALADQVESEAIKEVGEDVFQKGDANVDFILEDGGVVFDARLYRWPMEHVSDICLWTAARCFDVRKAACVGTFVRISLVELV